jgi:hypothetical protein
MQEPTQRYKGKPRRCPVCKHSPVATIRYGFVDYTFELENEINAGRVALGGCVIRLDGSQPKWKCTNCDSEFFPYPEPLPEFE